MTEIDKRKKTNLKIILVIPIVILAIAAFVMVQKKGMTSADDSAKVPSTDDTEQVTSEKKRGPVAPDFTLTGLDGRQVSLSDHKGKVVILNIWATWCPPCIAEAPSLDKFYKMMKDEDFELLAVSIDEDGERAVKPFMEKQKLSFPVLLDPQNRVPRMYRSSKVPESFIIRKDGTLDSKIEGAIDWTTPKLIDHIHKLLKES